MFGWLTYSLFRKGIKSLLPAKKKKGKATLFIHGLYLKLQACGAVYMKQIQIQIEQKFLLRIPTGGRLTSWLFTKRGGVEFGTTEDKSI